MSIEYVMPCPEGCEASESLIGVAEIVKSRPEDGSCWYCNGRGWVPHDGVSGMGVITLRKEAEDHE